MKLRLLIFICTFLAYIQLHAQTPVCRTSELVKEYHTANPVSKTAQQDFELYTQQYVNNKSLAKTTASKYIIPVVFHVYGTTQGGYTINDALIKLALKGLNDDFKGRNADYNSVHNQFKPLRDTLDIEFALATKDPQGNPTTGILYYPVKTGYGRASASDADIMADAWNNYMYMNFYIMVDLYANGVLNNSGVAWYPDINMTNNNLARVVYNGTYLATNNVGNPEFASVLTHECGHFLNLIHTFEGGCTSPNDNVADTPPCTTAQGCHSNASSSAPLNCNTNLVNTENYMDYNTNCYRMFTVGQVLRMKAALNHPARITLWQDSNIVKTGAAPVRIRDVHHQSLAVSTFPNPSTGNIQLTISSTENTTCRIYITNTSGQVVYKSGHSLNIGANTIGINLKNMPKGIYLLRTVTANSTSVHKFELN